MKNIIILLFFVFPLTLASQMLPGGLEEEEYSHKKTVDKDESNLFADYRIASPIINSKVGLEMGVDFGSTFGGDFFMGFGMHTLLSKNIEFEVDDEYGTPFLRMSHLGLLTGYDFDLSGYLSFTPSVELFMTHISYGTTGSADVSTDLNGQWGISVMPKIAVGYRFGSSMWLELQGGYRIMSGFDFKSIKNSDLKGVLVGLSIKTYI
jgi:hypothetical protein